ncbi:alpha/beta hydrolase-fold protein [Gordonia sp. CPCC 206044]|uniref:alpha/beta hydrolase n=1 Tax=Gordonia sp. CPCC 206044 TaxID=3140793 RepID=UPI003AF3C51B
MTRGPYLTAIDGDPMHHSVTIVAHTGDDVGRVLFVGNRIFDRERLGDGLLQRVDGTDQRALTLLLDADHRGSYQLAFETDGALGSVADLAARADADPLNPDRIPMRWTSAQASVLELPGAAPSRWSPVPAATPRGLTTTIRWGGDDLVSARDVYLYRTPTDEVETGVLVLSDGDMWFGKAGLARQLDAMAAAGDIGGLTVVAPSAVDVATRWAELSAQDGYADFLAAQSVRFATELGPVSDAPERWAIAGQSLGGLTALHTSVRHPDVFGRVIAQSPSLWWRPGSPHRVRLDAGPPWLGSHLATAAAHQRFRIDVGSYEGPMVDLARQAEAVLVEAGAGVEVTEYRGGHDHACWRVHLLDSIKEFFCV